MNSHILYVGFSQWSERLFIYRKFLYFIQCFQAINNPASWREHNVSYNFKWISKWITARQTKSLKSLNDFPCIIITFSRNTHSSSQICVLSKHCVLHVQVRLLCICDEKLGAICVWAIVCHRDHPSYIMLKLIKGEEEWGVILQTAFLINTKRWTLTFRCSLYSSSNLRPHMLVPPLPVPEWFIQRCNTHYSMLGLKCSKCNNNPPPVGSPVWTMKPLMFRWKVQPL